MGNCCSDEGIFDSSNKNENESKHEFQNIHVVIDEAAVFRTSSSTDILDQHFLAESTKLSEQSRNTIEKLDMESFVEDNFLDKDEAKTRTDELRQNMERKKKEILKRKSLSPAGLSPIGKDVSDSERIVVKTELISINAAVDAEAEIRNVEVRDIEKYSVDFVVNSERVEDKHDYGIERDGLNSSETTLNSKVVGISKIRMNTVDDNGTVSYSDSNSNNTIADVLTAKNNEILLEEQRKREQELIRDEEIEIQRRNEEERKRIMELQEKEELAKVRAALKLRVRAEAGIYAVLAQYKLSTRSVLA